MHQLQEIMAAAVFEKFNTLQQKNAGLCEFQAARKVLAGEDLSEDEKKCIAVSRILILSFANVYIAYH